MSSEMAAGKVLGMHVSSLTAESAAMIKGETPQRTALTLGATGADLIVMRMPQEDIVAKATVSSLVPVVNAGDGANEHPTQMLLDIATARRKLGVLEGSRWTIFGDIGHSRTLNSLVIALAKYNARLTFVYSEGLGPSSRTLHFLKKHKLSYAETSDLRGAVKGAQVLYGIRTQAERHKGKVVDSSVVLNQKVLKCLGPDTIIMHPGPHGPEIIDEVYDQPNAVFPVEQVRMGLHMRSALFDMLLGSYAYRAIMAKDVPILQTRVLNIA
jgi:aspartate carbamoyltransferase catalytic subunit